MFRLQVLFISIVLTASAVHGAECGQGEAQPNLSSKEDTLSKSKTKLISPLNPQYWGIEVGMTSEKLLEKMPSDSLDAVVHTRATNVMFFRTESKGKSYSVVVKLMRDRKGLVYRTKDIQIKLIKPPKKNKSKKSN